MNYIDILLIIIVLLSAWGGWSKGFIIGALDLLLMIGSLVAAFYFYPYLGAFLEKHWPSLGVWTLPLSFIFLIILARVILSFITSRVLRTVPYGTHDHILNKALGILPGIINGLIFSTIVSALLLSLPFSDGLSSATRDSQAAGKLAEQVEWLDEKLSPVFDAAVKKSMNKLTVEPSSEKSITLPFKVAEPRVREDLEAKMLVLVNEERQKAGLKPVQFDPELVPVARAHSQDMFARGYFSHVSPDGKDPFDRIRAAKVKFLAAGENLALGQTLTICHNGLMNSLGHRANILRPTFGRLGIGILDGGMYGLMISQEFRN